jgi:hypothetical protein
MKTSNKWSKNIFEKNLRDGNNLKNNMKFSDDSDDSNEN